MTDFIVLDNVTKTFEIADREPISVLADVDWRVAEGDTVAVTGPSGSGKSTLLNLIGSLDQPTAGAITVGGQRVDALAGTELSAYRAYQVGFVFQDHHLLPQLTALENVLLPTLAATNGGPANSRPLQRPAPERAEDLLQRVGLAERLHSFPGQLSGGERQRVAIARALINQPRLLLCDEPTGNLDRTTGEAVIGLLFEIAAAEGLTVLMVTHDLRHATACRQRLELREGRLQPSGGDQ